MLRLIAQGYTNREIAGELKICLRGRRHPPG
ncbi:MAG: hypothetical protein IPL78_11165 [Chloroflexi bacterium]|nr:hypothetical protein [Chloroflexota bacterium]